MVKKNKNRRPKRDVFYTLDFDDTKYFDRSSQQEQTIKSIKLTPRTPNQISYVANLQNKNLHIVFSIGPAGTGKSLLATQSAVKGLIENKYEKIILIRSAKPIESEEIGFLPGTATQKLDPYIANLVDILKETYSKQEIQKMIREEIIQVVPIAFVRGRTFKNAFIIIDEAQNTTKDSLLALLSRIGENSKMTVTGDLDQTDIRGQNGLQDFLQRYSKLENGIEGIAINYFVRSDIQRHPIISKVLELYDN